MGIELTQGQRAAVENRGGDLLVSAAAGSGKTRVLVERLMGYVEQGEDIDRFLVITFTNAAAAELRERIAAAIHARLAQRPGDRVALATVIAQWVSAGLSFIKLCRMRLQKLCLITLRNTVRTGCWNT